MLFYKKVSQQVKLRLPAKVLYGNLLFLMIFFQAAGLNIGRRINLFWFAFSLLNFVDCLCEDCQG